MISVKHFLSTSLLCDDKNKIQLLNVTLSFLYMTNPTYLKPHPGKLELITYLYGDKI